MISLDLKNEADKRTFLDMVENECDILIDPYRPGNGNVGILEQTS